MAGSGRFHCGSANFFKWMPPAGAGDVHEDRRSPVTASPRPVSWVRSRGAGRVFFTVLGKQDHSWLAPELLVPHHALGARKEVLGNAVPKSDCAPPLHDGA